MPDLGSLRRHPVRTAAGLLLFVVVLLALLALPFRGVQADADAARADLNAAVEAIQDGDTQYGFGRVRQAREHVDDVTGVTHGVSGTVWSIVPVVGGSIRDVRDLAAALDDLTSALEVAADLEPRVSGDTATLMQDRSVHLETLEDVLHGIRGIDTLVHSARTRLEDVDDSDRFLGTRLADARDDALSKVVPVSDGMAGARPLFDVLPGVLGAEGRKTYVLAMMNPAEMKYSGGSMLTFSEMHVEDGTITRGRSRNTGDNPRIFRPRLWQPVEGNPFHPGYMIGITKANIAPSWPVSGEETLRSWSVRTGREADGLIAADVAAVGKILDATGPLQIPGIEGDIDSQRLIELTVASYDLFGEDHPQRRRLNKALIPAFLDRVFGGVDFFQVLQAVTESAHGRHLALYFRDGDLQDAASKVRFDGDLGPADQDYLGVFTQNQVGSKADMWQRKEISSVVRLREDGSARVRLTAQVHNDGPAQLVGLGAYLDPTLDTSVAAFLPEGARVQESRLEHSTWGTQVTDAEVKDYFGRPFIEPRTEVGPGQSATLTVVYRIPRATVAYDDGMIYRLAIDNHPTVRPEQVSVTVHWPEGYQVNTWPLGWEAVRDGVTRWQTDELESTERLEITARN